MGHTAYRYGEQCRDAALGRAMLTLGFTAYRFSRVVGVIVIFSHPITLGTGCFLTQLLPRIVWRSYLSTDLRCT